MKKGSLLETDPSVHLANIMAQCWGNLRISCKVVSVDATTVTSEAVCFDLEKNLAVQVNDIYLYKLWS